ncbi:MAG: Lrp/AsnC ligand binding domain-containing protein [Candidatus Bathyarchaeota archaeon]|jgi:DNA-binding Lrp family transcriptional regulator
MPEAYVLVSTEVGSEDEVLEDLKKLDTVKEAHCVYGTYDIVARIEADSMDELKEATTWKVRKINKVRDTLTMIITK